MMHELSNFVFNYVKCLNCMAHICMYNLHFKLQSKRYGKIDLNKYEMKMNVCLNCNLYLYRNE